MNEALILERLDRLSAEVQLMRSEVLREVRQELEPIRQKVEMPPLAMLLKESDDPAAREDLEQLVMALSGSLAELTEAVEIIKAGVQLRQDMAPVIRQTYPRTLEFFAELDGDFYFDELVILLRKAITNLDTIGEGIDLLRAGVELRDDLVPMLQLLYPRLIRFLNALHEGEFQAEKLGDLLHTILINIHTLSDLLNMIQPMTEFVKEVGVVLKETDVMHGINTWLDGLQQSSGLVKLAGTMFTFMKRIDCNEAQIEQICQAINTLDLTRVQPVGPLDMIRQLRDPKVQEALGFFFMMLRVTGSCLQAYQADKNQQQATA
jgi:uncharacterized protein YjgD (DUF1641 family)